MYLEIKSRVGLIVVELHALGLLILIFLFPSMELHSHEDEIY